MRIFSAIRPLLRPMANSGIVQLPSLLDDATTALGGIAPYHYWDFTQDRALFARVDVKEVTSTPGWSFTRATVGTAETASGQIIQFASGEIRRTDKGLLIEGARTNLFLNSATGATQNVTVAATAHTLTFRGTGTITLSGTSTAGPLVGTGVNDRVALTFTPTAGTLTLTVSGSCTNVQLEAGGFATSWIPTAGSSVTRNADVLTVSSPGIDYPMTLFADFTRAVDVGAAEINIHVEGSGGATDRAFLGTDSFDRANGAVTTSSAVQANYNPAGSLALNTRYRLAMRVAANSAQFVANGVLGTEDTAVTVPATPTLIRIGTRESGNFQSYGYTRRLALFNSALTDAQLQTITT